MYNTQLQLVSTGICRGEIQVTNEELAKKAWVKYKTNGERDGESRRTSADDIFKRLGVRSRPHASNRQTHTSMFNSALDQAVQRAATQGAQDIQGNLIAIFAGSTTPQRRIPNFLDKICEQAGLYPTHPREFISQACSSFNNGVNRLSHYVEQNPGLEGYAVVGAAEIIQPEWRDNNFDSVIFGDLASVAILKVTPNANLPISKRGIIGCLDVHTPDTGPKPHIIRLEDGLLYMNGKAVMKTAPRAMIEDCQRSTELAGLSLRDINQFIFHTGSQHIIHKLGISLIKPYGKDLDIANQLPHYLEDSGNNGAATTPHVLHRQLVEGKISPTDKVYMGAIGMGYYRSSFIINGFPFLKATV